MKVLFATKNPAKVRRFSDKLKAFDIELITIKDLDFELKIEETGSTALENARIKAKAYYEATGIPTIGMDDNLYFENVPQEKQPGTHVRRINGKELTDDEMIEYYSNLAKEFGGKIESKWIYGMVVFSPKGSFEHSWSLGHCYIVDKPSSKRNPGYPISSLSIDRYTGKYLSEMTPEDKEKNEKNYNENHVVKFIAESVS